MNDATALAAAISDGRSTARAAMEASLAACARMSDLGAVVHVDPAMGRASADTADATPRARRGPLHGVPVLIKDLGSAARGLPAAAGSTALRRITAPPVRDDDLIAGLRTAGLIPFGVTATPPFGLSLSCTPDGLPPTRNPWNPALTPGGSSGGAAAAVAGGIVAIAHATDAAGSIRVPAACCGLTGLKPSRGAVPGGPGFSNYLMGLASELVVARSVRDVATVFGAVRRAPGLPRPANAPPARIGLVLPARCGAEQNAAAEAAGAALVNAGCTLSPLPAPDALGTEAQALVRTILSVSLAEWLVACGIADDAVPPLAAAMAAEGRALPAPALFAATRDLARLEDRASRLFDDLDAVVMPTLASAPPPVAAFDLAGDDPATHWAVLAAFAPNAALANAAGLPALALPFGRDAGGLPLGVQLLGPQGADSLLLALGAQIEASAPALAFPHPIAGLAA